MPRTGEPGFSNMSTAYGQLLRKMASPLPKARRVISSSPAVTQPGLAPVSMSMRMKRKTSSARWGSGKTRPSSPTSVLPSAQRPSSTLTTSPSYCLPCQR